MVPSSIPCLSSRTYPVETGTPPYWQSAGSMSETFLLFRQIVHLHGLSPLFFGRFFFCLAKRFLDRVQYRVANREMKKLCFLACDADYG